HYLTLIFFLLYYPATTEIYTLSLHDALPISITRRTAEDESHRFGEERDIADVALPFMRALVEKIHMTVHLAVLDQGEAVYIEKRSEEHTSELQSPYDLVCRLLLEKKKQKNRT